MSKILGLQIHILSCETKQQRWTQEFIFNSFVCIDSAKCADIRVKPSVLSARYMLFQRSNASYAPWTELQKWTREQNNSHGRALAELFDDDFPSFSQEGDVSSIPQWIHTQHAHTHTCMHSQGLCPSWMVLKRHLLIKYVLSCAQSHLEFFKNTAHTHAHTDTHAVLHHWLPPGHKCLAWRCQ